MKVLSVASARPNFVKLAAVHHAFQEAALPESKHVIVHTGQHYDPMFSDVFFQELNIPLPDENLGVRGEGKNDETVEKTREALVPVLQKFQPNVVLVYGDVSGAFGAAKAAEEVDIPLAHVEAGLRSFDDAMPEEHNRKGIDHLAQLLFVTESSGEENLKREGVKGEVHVVGNTMIDTLIRMMPVIEQQKGIDAIVSLPFAIVTLHRPSNVDADDPLRRNLVFLEEVACCIPLILPCHRRLQLALKRCGLWECGDVRWELEKHMYLCDALGYLSFIRLMQRSSFILTDSGGIQEEATFLKKRCFTLRKNTERPSTVESGSNVLINLDREEDRQRVFHYAKNPIPPDVTIPPLWDGEAGERIIEVLRNYESSR